MPFSLDLFNAKCSSHRLPNRPPVHRPQDLSLFVSAHILLSLRLHHPVCSPRASASRSPGFRRTLSARCKPSRLLSVCLKKKSNEGKFPHGMMKTLLNHPETQELSLYCCESSVLFALCRKNASNTPTKKQKHNRSTRCFF